MKLLPGSPLNQKCRLNMYLSTSQINPIVVCFLFSSFFYNTKMVTRLMLPCDSSFPRTLAPHICSFMSFGSELCLFYRQVLSERGNYKSVQNVNTLRNSRIGFIFIDNAAAFSLQFEAVQT